MLSYRYMKSFQWNAIILRWHIILAQPYQQKWNIIANGTIFCQISSRFLFSVPFPINLGLSDHFTYRSWKPPFNLSPPSAAYMHQWIRSVSIKIMACCPACRTTLVATRFRVAVICPIIQVPHCIRVFFYFVWFVFINHIFQFYYELCTYCNILDIYLS